MTALTQPTINVEPEDAPLVQQSLRGDRTAYDCLVRRYQNVLFGLVLGRLHNRQDAADAVQDAFVSGYLKLHTLKEPEAFGAWIRSIAINAARQVTRKRSTVAARELGLDSESHFLEKVAGMRFEEEDARRDLWGELQQLSKLQREAIVLHYVSGLSYDEISEALEVPVSTVRGRLQKGRRKLRLMMIEEMKRMSIDLTDRVGEEICRIARSEIRVEIDPGDVEHVSISLDVPTELRVIGHDGPNIVVTGHKTAIGGSQDQAEIALDGIQLCHDIVDDWIDFGSHEGERFCGTNMIEGKPVATIRKSGGRNTVFDRPRRPSVNDIDVTDLFPSSGPSKTTMDRMRDAMPRRACQVSVIYRKVTDAALPVQSVTDSLREGFAGNWHGETVVHGQVGKASLEIRVPRSLSVTLGGRTTGDTRIQGLGGMLLLLNCHTLEISDIGRDVLLFHSISRSVSRIGGAVHCFFHDYYGNGNWANGKRSRPTAQEMGLFDVKGNVKLDLGYVALCVENPGADVIIRKRSGPTLLRTRRWRQRPWRVDQIMDDVAVELPDELLSDLAITSASLTGEMDYARPEELTGNAWISNNPELAVYCSKPRPDMGERSPIDADIVLISEAGNVKILSTGE